MCRTRQQHARETHVYSSVSSVYSSVYSPEKLRASHMGDRTGHLPIAHCAERYANLEASHHAKPTRPTVTRDEHGEADLLWLVTVLAPGASSRRRRRIPCSGGRVVNAQRAMAPAMDSCWGLWPRCHEGAKLPWLCPGAVPAQPAACLILERKKCDNDDIL
eukprot:9470821-Pyramimonas_sp.AAC.1